MAANYSSLWDDDEQQKQGTEGATGGAAPTFAQLQQRGLPRPPPTNYGSGGMPMAQPYATTMTPGLPPPGGGSGFNGYGGIYVGQTPDPTGRGGTDRDYFHDAPGGDAGPGGPNVNPGVGGGPPPDTGGQEDLNQSTLEAYLYKMLTDPTNTITYQNMMRRLQSGIDTDASRRGVYHSSIPVGIGADAGAGLAAQLQREAYGNLSDYNKEMEQYLLALYGLT